METLTHRKCNRCEIEKPVSELVASKRYVGGYMPLCKLCRNKYWKNLRETNPEHRRRYIDTVLRSKMLKTYGMVAADYERMVKEQDDLCKLCGSDDPGRGDRFRVWNIDHCHDTGRVRGLLCHKCNTRLGHHEALLKEVSEDKIKAYLAHPKPKVIA